MNSSSLRWHVLQACQERFDSAKVGSARTRGLASSLRSESLAFRKMNRVGRISSHYRPAMVICKTRKKQIQPLRAANEKEGEEGGGGTYGRYDELLVRLRVEVSEPDVALLVEDPERMQHLRLFVRVRQTDVG